MSHQARTPLNACFCINESLHLLEGPDFWDIVEQRLKEFDHSEDDEDERGND